MVVIWNHLQLHNAMSLRSGEKKTTTKKRLETEAITKFSHGAVIQKYNGNVQKQAEINSGCILRLADSQERGNA